jgi:hypothetical protein
VEEQMISFMVDQILSTNKKSSIAAAFVGIDIMILFLYDLDQSTCRYLCTQLHSIKDSKFLHSFVWNIVVPEKLL